MGTKGGTENYLSLAASLGTVLMLSTTNLCCRKQAKHLGRSISRGQARRIPGEKGTRLSLSVRAAEGKDLDQTSGTHEESKFKQSKITQESDSLKLLR